MARVKLIVNKDDVAPEHHALFDTLAALRGRISGPSTIVLHSPGLARPWNEMSEFLHRQSIVEPEHAFALSLASLFRRGRAARPAPPPGGGGAWRSPSPP